MYKVALQQKKHSKQTLKFNKLNYDFLSAIDHRNYKGVNSCLRLSRNGIAYNYWHTKDMLNFYSKFYRNDINMYTCLNTFRSWDNSQDDNVIGINAFWVDIDCESNNVRKDYVYHNLNDWLADAQVTQPTSIVDSGHGLYAIYFLDHTYINNSYRFSHKWETTEKGLVRIYNAVLRPYVGNKDICDKNATNIGRQLRLPSTNNVKYNHKRTCKVLQMSNNFYDWHMLLDEFEESISDFNLWDHKKNNGNHSDSKKDTDDSSIDVTFIYAKLAQDRLIDLKYLKNNLRHNNIEVGYRDKYFYIYACTAYFIKNIDEITNALEKLNAELIHPLKPSEIRKIERQAIHHDLRVGKNKDKSFRNSTIIDYLDITPNEQQWLKTIIGPQEMKKRREIVVAKQREDRQHDSENSIDGAKFKRHKRNEKIRYLHSKGMSYRKIANKLKIGLSTVKRVFKDKNNKEVNKQRKDRQYDSKYSSDDAKSRRSKRNSKIKEMHSQGMSYRKIASKLKIGLSTVRRVFEKERNCVQKSYCVQKSDWVQKL